MKITLSKSQWEEIGKQTGWIKQANFMYTVEEILSGENLDQEGYDRSGDFYEMTAKVSAPSNDFIVNFNAYFEFERAQHGGRTDPSWPAHFSFLGTRVTNIEAIDEDGNITPTTVTDEEKKNIEKTVRDYAKSQADDYCNTLINRRDEY
jgi:formylmethanofuran dehydrogenase subunit E-like metal-binding protein